MKLYFAPLACSMASRIVAEEAGAALDLIEIDPATKRVLATGDDYRAIYPLALVPLLVKDDGTFVAENAAILQYIADDYPDSDLAPPASDRASRAKLQQWLSFIGTELHKGLFIPLLDPKAPADAKDWALAKGAEKLAYLDAHLAGRDFVLDRFSIADAYLATVLNWTRATPQIDLAAYPAIKAYWKGMQARPSIAKALATEVPLFQAEMARKKAA